MIVGQMFKYDDDDEVAWKQHDVYGQALATIVAVCNELVTFARSVLQDEVHHEWGTCSDFDHRTLQCAHDILAAAWRFRNDTKQFVLPFGTPTQTECLEELWLTWLRNEVMAWTEQPNLVRFVQFILTNQNKPLGYAAEARLCLDLMQRFPEMPWDRRIVAAHRADLSKYSSVLQNSVEQGGGELKEHGECECVNRGKSSCNQIPCKTTIALAAREGWGPLE